MGLDFARTRKAADKEVLCGRSAANKSSETAADSSDTTITMMLVITEEKKWGLRHHDNILGGQHQWPTRLAATISGSGRTDCALDADKKITK